MNLEKHRIKKSEKFWKILRTMERAEFGKAPFLIVHDNLSAGFKNFLIAELHRLVMR